MTIQVYRGAEATILLNLEQAVFTYGKMAIRELVFSMEASSVLDIKIGDTLTYQEEIMQMNYTPTYTNAGKKRRNYTIVFEGKEAGLIDSPLVHEGDVTFSYFGDASDLMNLLLANINSLDAGWTVLEVDDVEPQAFEFDNVHCLSALSTIAQKFELEWKINKKAITLKKNIGVERSVVLSQGQGNGLYELKREYLKDSNIYTRAYALGGEENLPEGMEGKRLALDDYIDKNTHVYGIKPNYYVFNDVYPQRTGTATAVNKLNDKSYTLTDTSLDFDLNGQRAGENDVKIVFTSGALNGQEFIMSRYNPDTKTITYKANEDKAGRLIPFSATVAAVGDKYKLVGLIMPQTYVDAAKEELRTKRAEALDKDSVPKVVYSLNADVLFLKQNGLLLTAGDIVRVQDADIDLDELLTIQRVSYPAIFPTRLISGMQFTAEVGNTSYAKLNDKLYEDSQKQIVINGELRKQNAELARLNALHLRELQNYIFDADDYFDVSHIKPQSIETQMLSVGAKSQNFFLSGVTMQPNYQGNPNSFFVSGGQLQHREISIAAGFIWVLNQQLFNGLDASKPYYLSAKCNKTQLIGTYNLTTDPIKVEDEDGFYNFNVGVLYPVKDGKRYFANTAGVTYVVGNQINTGRIQSMDGQTWFDLDTGEIHGDLRLTNGQTIDEAVEVGVNDIKVGGQNLFAYGDFKNRTKMTSTGFGVETIAIEKDPFGIGGYFNKNILFFDGRTNDIYQPLTPKISLKAGVEYTISFMAKMASTGNIQGSSSGIYSNSGFIVIPFGDELMQDGEWVKVENTFTSLDTTEEATLRFGIVTNATYSWFAVTNIKIEEGNKATDWSPALKDAEFGNIYVRGTGLNQTDVSSGKQMVNGITTVDDATSGWQFRVYNPEDLSIYEERYFFYGDWATLRDVLAWYNGQPEGKNKIIVINSYDYILLRPEIREQLIPMGGIDDPALELQNRHPWAFIGQVGIGAGAGFETYSGTEASARSAELNAVVRNGRLVGKDKTVTYLGNRISSAEFKLRPDQINLTVKEQTERIAADASKRFRTSVDARGLDQNTFFPIIIPTHATQPITITVERTLSAEYGVPHWSTHGAGFSLICRWTTNGNGWGTVPINRTIDEFVFAHANYHPVGSIGQLTNGSEEYIFVRGGSIYFVDIIGLSEGEIRWPIQVHSGRYNGVGGQYVDPLPDTDRPERTFQSKDEIKAGISIKANAINVFGQDIFLDGAVTIRSLSGEGQDALLTVQGKIRADRIDVIELFAQDVVATGQITAQNLLVTGRSKIGEWSIGDGIYNGQAWEPNGNYSSFSPGSFLLRKTGNNPGNNYDVVEVAMGYLGMGVEIGAKIINNRQGSAYDNTALWLEANGGGKNTALLITKGVISGLAVSRDIYQSGGTYYIDVNCDSMIVSGTGSYMMMMPASPRDGKVINYYRSHSSNTGVFINGNGKSVQYKGVVNAGTNIDGYGGTLQYVSALNRWLIFTS